MRKEGEAHAAEDNKRKEEVEVRNTADNLAYTAEKTLRDNKEKIPEAMYKEVEGKITGLRDAMKGTSVDVMKKASQDLNDAMMKIGPEIQKQQQPPQPPPGGNPPPPGDRKMTAPSTVNSRGLNVDCESNKGIK